MEDLSAEVLNLMDENDDSAVEENLSTKFPCFTKKYYKWFIASLKNRILLICNNLGNLEPKITLALRLLVTV